MSARKSKSAPRNIARERKIADALEYRLAGHSFPAIASELRISTGTAYNYVREALDRIIDAADDNAERLKAMELERLDRLFASIFSDATDQNVAPIQRATAVELVLKVMERRAKLFGLDKAEKVAVGGLPPIVISPTDANL